ncbi:beta-defensin 119-like [Choloepus didactylus]|uniref:beta-defensin 119-like n=1 Tax=Choloepus didactylus TaxID=27675 RepID=UPI0018A0168F|nr:beta-defensin 119-like [Choloepus didactylus]
MKLLFLFLAILLVMEPVAPGRHHSLPCLGNKGTCRVSCKKDEKPYLYCRNYQPCCVQSYVKINTSAKEERNHHPKTS